LFYVLVKKKKKNVSIPPSIFGLKQKKVRYDKISSGDKFIPVQNRIGQKLGRKSLVFFKLHSHEMEFFLEA
jgi:hypothetical protein